MKKILSFVAAIMIATTATAQTAMELARQQQELNAINMKMLNATPPQKNRQRNKQRNLRLRDGQCQPET